MFRVANQHRMPIVVHMRASVSRRFPYGREEGRIFLNEILPAAPDIPVQVAHMAGAGGYSDRVGDEVMAVFAEAAANSAPRTKHLYFGVTTVALPNEPADRWRVLADRIRQVGVQRIPYGSGAATGGDRGGVSQDSQKRSVLLAVAGLIA